MRPLMRGTFLSCFVEDAIRERVPDFDLSAQRKRVRNMSFKELTAQGYPVFGQGVKREARDFAETLEAPYETYQAGVHFAARVLYGLQKRKLSYPSQYLDFGTGRMHSLSVLGRSIDMDVFNEVWAYEPSGRDTHYFDRQIGNGSVWHTTVLPDWKFDVVTMFFVTSLGLNAIDDAVSVMKKPGYLILYDYDLKNASQEDVTKLCSTDLERELIKEDATGFYQRTSQFGMDDYISRMAEHGAGVFTKQKIGRKFCVLVGKK